MATASDHFVTVEGLVKRFGDMTAVNGVSFEVGNGDTLALLGPSGCGKTTILRCLAGLETPDAGRIEVGGRVVFDSERRIDLMPEERELGIVFQSYAVWPHMSVADNVGFPLKVRRVPKRMIEERVKRILDIVGLGAWMDRPATQLSGGQQQRVALARALIHEPRLVLFDEALSNLDAQLREQMRTELKLLQDRLNFTAIYVTHDQSEAFALAQHVVVMNRGSVEARGAPRTVFHWPQTPFVAEFLGLNAQKGIVRQVAEAADVPGAEGEPGAPYARVELAGGASLWGRIGQDRALREGDPVLVCIRKEHLRLGPAGSAAGNGMPGRIEASSFLGLFEEYVLATPSGPLRAVHPVVDLSTGADVFIAAEPAHCIVLTGPQEAAGAAPADVQLAG